MGWLAQVRAVRARRGARMARADFTQQPVEDRPRAPVESQIAGPSLNIFLGSTPAFAAPEMMRQMISLPEIDSGRAALMYTDIDSPPTQGARFLPQHLGDLPL